MNLSVNIRSLKDKHGKRMEGGDRIFEKTGLLNMGRRNDKGSNQRPEAARTL